MTGREAAVVGLHGCSRLAQVLAVWYWSSTLRDPNRRVSQTRTCSHGMCV